MKYFDHAATTPVAEQVKNVMLPYLEDTFGNPGSLHSFGSDASKGIIQARQQVAEFLNCQMQEVYFTSGATESNNMFLKGLLEKGDHLIVSVIEHPSVFEVAKFLEAQEDLGIEVSFAPIDEDGLVSAAKIEQLIKENTKVISIMFVNNELGTIQPISELGEIIENLNKKRSQKIYFHTDAVQAVPYIKLDVQALKVDALSFTGHKIYGPKGSGVLYLKKGIDLTPILHGGGHELGRRSGTENVAGILGLAEATRYIQQNYDKLEVVKELRDDLLLKLQNDFPQMKVYGDMDLRVPGNLNISFPKVEGEQLIYLLDLEGFAVSSVSACSSKALKPSKVLLAMGASNEEARGTIRITLGLQTSQEDINELFTAIVKVVKKLK